MDAPHSDESHDPTGPARRHGHWNRHGMIDPAIANTDRGVWALKWSFLGLLATALLQLLVVAMSGSVDLLADAIHNVADAATAIPLGIAFGVARLKPTRRFPYGYGRVEDLAGVVIVLIILLSTLLAGYEALRRLSHPEPVTHLAAVALASIIGCLGNETVAVFRIKMGRAIGSVALVADGYHARADGLTSLAVLVGAAGLWLGYPLADAIVGLVITLPILALVWQSAREIVVRMLDGVDPRLLEVVEQAARHVPGIHQVTDARARWIGHWIAVELNVAVRTDLTVGQGRRRQGGATPDRAPRATHREGDGAHRPGDRSR
jgi:cation diffusion facilitator family transporter